MSVRRRNRIIKTAASADSKLFLSCCGRVAKDNAATTVRFRGSKKAWTPHKHHPTSTEQSDKARHNQWELWQMPTGDVGLVKADIPSSV